MKAKIYEARICWVSPKITVSVDVAKLCTGEFAITPRVIWAAATIRGAVISAESYGSSLEYGSIVVLIKETDSGT